MPSMPTDRRTSAGSTSSGEPATDRWVIAAGHLDERLDAAERLGQREQARPLGDRDRAARRPSRPCAPPAAGHERDHPAEPRVVDVGDVRAVAQERARRPAAFAPWRSIRRCSVRSPRRTRKQSSGPGTAPIAFWRKRSRSATASSEVTATPRIVSEWPARYFVAEWKTMSAPERRAAAGAPARRTCCRRRPAAAGRPRPRAARRSSAAAAMSTTLRCGFDGVSNQTSRVRSVSASQSASGPAREVDVAGVDAGAAADPLEVAERAAVDVVADDDLVAGPGQLGDRRGRPPSPTRRRSRGVPPSRAATARSSRSRVGFCERAYS